MSSSHARLVVERREGVTRATHASATVPQRWTVPPRSGCSGLLEVTHQLLGDGVFGGDCHRTSILAAPGAAVLVRSVAATPLRGPAPGATVVHLTAAPGATLLYLPGALVPHRDADFRSVLSISAHPEARVLAASIIVPGRTGMDESGTFRRLQLRTAARVGGEVAFGEDATIAPATVRLDGPAGFAGAGASLTILALGTWPPATREWWDLLRATPGVVGGAGRLPSGGACYRALCGSLGDAQAAVARVVMELHSLL